MSVKLPEVNSVSIEVPAFFIKQTKKGWKLVNPLNATRSISTRGKEKAIEIVRSNVSDPKLDIADEDFEPPHISEFSKTDQAKIRKYWSGRFKEKKGKPRGRPVYLEKNAQHHGIPKSENQTYSDNPKGGEIPITHSKRKHKPKKIKNPTALLKKLEKLHRSKAMEKLHRFKAIHRSKAKPITAPKQIPQIALSNSGPITVDVNPPKPVPKKSVRRPVEPASSLSSTRESIEEAEAEDELPPLAPLELPPERPTRERTPRQQLRIRARRILRGITSNPELNKRIKSLGFTYHTKSDKDTPEQAKRKDEINRFNEKKIAQMLNEGEELTDKALKGRLLPYVKQRGAVRTKEYKPFSDVKIPGVGPKTTKMDEETFSLLKIKAERGKKSPNDVSKIEYGGNGKYVDILIDGKQDIVILPINSTLNKTGPPIKIPVEEFIRRYEPEILHYGRILYIIADDHSQKALTLMRERYSQYEEEEAQRKAEEGEEHLTPSPEVEELTPSPEERPRRKIKVKSDDEIIRGMSDQQINSVVEHGITEGRSAEFVQKALEEMLARRQRTIEASLAAVEEKAESSSEEAEAESSSEEEGSEEGEIKESPRRFYTERGTAAAWASLAEPPSMVSVVEAEIQRKALQRTLREQQTGSPDTSWQTRYANASDEERYGGQESEDEPPSPSTFYEGSQYGLGHGNGLFHSSGCGLMGGKLPVNEIQKFVEASYKPMDQAQNVGNYELDEDLSTKLNKVYRDPNTGHVVIANAGTSSLLDWKNNLNPFGSVLFGNYEKTDRYKDVENTQRRAIEKYGKHNVENVGHSQSGEALRILAKRGLINESTALNPAILGKSHEGVDVIKSDRDLVSYLTPMGENDQTIKAETWNPLTEHSPEILSRIASGGSLEGFHPELVKKAMEHFKKISPYTNMRNHGRMSGAGHRVRHPALASAHSELIPGAYNNIRPFIHGGDLQAKYRNRAESGEMGGRLGDDMRNLWHKIPEHYHKPIESIADSARKDLGFGLGGRLGDDMRNLWHKIPQQYHAPIEEIARHGVHDAGFGLSGRLGDEVRNLWHKIPEHYHKPIESILRSGQKDIGFGLGAGLYAGGGSGLYAGTGLYAGGEIGDGMNGGRLRGGRSMSTPMVGTKESSYTPKKMAHEIPVAEPIHDEPVYEAEPVHEPKKKKGVNRGKKARKWASFVGNEAMDTARKVADTGMYIKKLFGGKLEKGSPEAKEFMRKLRERKKIKGGDLPPRSRGIITDPSLL